MGHPQTAPTVCPDKSQLADDIRTAMNQIITLNKRQLEAVIAGNFAESQSLETQLATARRWKDRALETYKRHLTSHGC